MILLFLLGIGSIGLTQNTYKYVVAEKGEGIWSLLRKNGLNPAKHIAEFKKINKELLSKNGELVVGVKYLLPGTIETKPPSESNKNFKKENPPTSKLKTDNSSLNNGSKNVATSSKVKKKNQKLYENNVNAVKSTIAEKGEGIWSLLRRNGLNPTKNLEEFKRINQALLRNNGELIAGQKYRLPGYSENNTKDNESHNQTLNEVTKKSANELGDNNTNTTQRVENRHVNEFKYNPNFKSLDAILVDKGEKVLGSGESSNMVVILINQTDVAKEFQLRISVPEAWSSLTDYSSLMVAKKSKKIKVLSFYIPELTSSGKDTIKVQVLNQTDNNEIALLNIPVFIEPRYEIAIERLPAQEYVFAGDSLMINFKVQNLSNVEVDVITTVINQKLENKKTITLKQNDHAYIRVPIATNKEILLQTRKSVNLTATIIKMPDISVSESYAYDIIPTKNIKFDAYNRFPIQVAINAVTAPEYYESADESSKRQYGYMLDIGGKGSISAKKKRMVEFHLRKPDKEGNPLFGQSEEFYVKYSTDKLNIVAGDNNYSLSDLTESSRFGRGASLETAFKKIMFGAFVNYPKYYPELKMVYSAYSSYYPTKNLRLNIGYLNKILVSDLAIGLFTVSTTATLFKIASIDVEYAAGKKDEKLASALKANLQINGSKLRGYANYTKASEDFPGYYTNSKYLSLGMSTTILKNINISTSYELNNSNAALDTLYANSPLSTNLSFAANVRIKKRHSLGIAFNMRSREDRFEPKLFHYEDKTFRITSQIRWKKFEINAYGEVGKIRNLLETQVGELTSIYKSYLSLLYKISNRFTMKAFANYNGGQYYETRSQNSIYYGTSLDAYLWNKLSMMIEYQNNHEIEEYYKDRSLLSSKIRYTMNKKHEISLSVNYNLTRNTLDSKAIYLSFSYKHHLNVPLSKKKDIGSLKGRLINKGVNSVEGVTFALAGIATQTDKDGYFEFPMLKSGSYFLLMDDSNTGLNTIAETPGPYKVDVLPGIVNTFEIALTKSASIIGSIIIQEDANKGNKGYIPIKEEIGILILEISKGDELFRVYSSKEGFFRFGDLRIGNWQVKVYENGIPEGYELITSQFQTELSSGEVKVIEVLIKKKSRRIKFQRRK